MRTFTSIFLALGIAGSIVACDQSVDSEDPVLEVRAANKLFCGGIAGIQCPGSMTCIDDPSDDCSPASGGADCGGMCVGNPGHGPNGNANCHASDEPGTTYLADSPEECAVIHFFCAEGYEPFFNDCGCGCTPASGEL